jgi:excinuclease ABC subunit C
LPSAVTDSRLQSLRDTVRQGAANRPGVYRMLAESGVVIYVGKSKRVRTRLMGYFRARQEEKAWRIVREARGLDWEYVPSEFASLLLELELIKRYRPPFNVAQKRDGVYSFLKLTSGAAPKLHVVRRIADEPGEYFGPFRGGKRIVEAVRELNDVLQLRDCRSGTPMRFSDQSDLFGLSLTPRCPRHELRRCLGPCAGLCSESEYARQIEQATRFLHGDATEPLEDLERRMSDAAERWEFEHAASIRNRIGRLEMIRAEFLRLRETLEGLSFLYVVPGHDSDHRVYAIRNGSIRASYPAPRTRRQRERLLAAAAEHFTRLETKAESNTPQRVEQILLVAYWFRNRPAELERAYPQDRWKRLPLTATLDRQGMA